MTQARRRLVLLPLLLSLSPLAFAQEPTECTPRIQSLGNQYIVKFAEPALARASGADRSAMVSAKLGANARWLRSGAMGTEIIRFDGINPGEARRAAQAFAKRGDVEYLVEDAVFQPLYTPADPRFPEQVSLFDTAPGISATSAWNRTFGAGTVIAIVDTGITWHPDLNGNVLPGYDFILDPRVARDMDGRDPNPRDEGDFIKSRGCDPVKSTWHGTHVAGIAAAVRDNGAGISGTAPDARILPVRVLGAGGGLLSDIAAGIVWAAGGSVPGVPDNPNPAEVINLSLGARDLPCGPVEQAAVTEAISRGAVVVAAAGNFMQETSLTPASCAGVISVGATHANGGRATFSNYGSSIDISAPGVNVLSTIHVSDFLVSTNQAAASGYTWLSGTSMSAPHVSGVVALMQSVSPRTPAQVEAILKATAKPFPIACTGCGAGIVNANAAVAALAGQPTASFTATPRPASGCPSSYFTTLTSTSTDPDDGIVSHLWNLPDGTTATTPTVNKVVVTAGFRRIISLTVRDAAGNTATASLDVGYRCLY